MPQITFRGLYSSDAILRRAAWPLLVQFCEVCDHWHPRPKAVGWKQLRQVEAREVGGWVPKRRPEGVLLLLEEARGSSEAPKVPLQPYLAEVFKKL